MKRKLLVWLLMISIGAGALAGCGNKTSSEVYTSAEEPDTGAYYNMTETSEAPEDEASAETATEELAYSEMPEEDWSRDSEEYSEIREKGFLAVYDEPLSTFSADVDTASYSNLRRMIEAGYEIEDIPEGAVRIEEIINYFSYNDLNEPEKGEPFGVTTQIAPCPWNEEAQLVRIGLKTEEINYKQLPTSNLVFLLDVSGSMHSDDKLPLLQESFALLAENLTKKDRVSIVTYAGDDTVVIEGVRGDKTDVILEALYELEAGGSTHGSKGIETAYSLAEDYFIEDGNNRVILATDGDLNVGLTSEEELEDLITEKKESGIFLSVLGFGTGNIKDNKMEILADKGNGNYAYIDSLKEANKVLVEEMGATLVTVCKDVKFQVEFNPEMIEEYRLIGYENRRLENEDFDNDRKDAGEIGAGHCVTALYEIIMNEEIDEEEMIEGEEDWLTISVRYKEPTGHKSSLLEYPVNAASYTDNPNEEFQFVAAAAEFGLVAMDSKYQADASLKHVSSTLRKLDLDDEYKEEFSDLVRLLRENSR